MDNFIKDIGEMLRKPTTLIEQLKSKNLSEKQAKLWQKIKFFFGPTGGYVRWTWSLTSPCILLVIFLLFLNNIIIIFLCDNSYFKY